MKTQGSRTQASIPSYKTAVRIAAAALLLASIIVSAPSAFAAGLKVTGGSLTINSQNSSSFTLTGPFFTVTGTTNSPGSGYGIFCNPCSSQLDVSFGPASQDFLPGDGRVKSNNGPTSVLPLLDWYTIFNGGPTYIIINGPAIPLTGPGYYVGSTSFVVTMCGIKTVTISPHCDVNVPYQTGTGSVVVQIAKDPNTGNLLTVSATYFF